MTEYFTRILLHTLGNTEESSGESFQQ